MIDFGMISKPAVRFGLAGICGLGVCVARAAVFDVNLLTDGIDASPGDGACEVVMPVNPGDCTLRAAIMEANARPGADDIILPAGTYTLSLAGVDETCCSGTGTAGDPYVPNGSPDDSVGDLDIIEDVTISGAGPDLTFIEWAANPALPDTDPDTGDRIFHVQTNSASIGSVTIQDLTVRNGEVGLVPTDATSYAATGTNAYDIEWDDTVAGALKIWQFRRMGGAIGLGASNAVVLYEETVHGPGGGGGGGGMGGGSDNGGPFPGGKPGEDDSLTIGSVTLNRVGVLASWAGADGGGVYSAVPATVSESIVSGNTSGANGGGIYNDAVMTISYSTVGRLFDAAAPADLTSPNVAENGGGLFDTGAHTTTIVGSAFNGNDAIGGGAIAGRAGVIINMDNSTVSSNHAGDVAGGINTNGTVNLHNVTVKDNASDSDAPGGGGGLNSFGGGVFTFHNTLLQGNTKVDDATTMPPTLTVANCGCSGGGACPPGRMISDGYNIADDASCELLVAAGLDLDNTDAVLGPLADNGGLSETHAVLAGSPALDAGDDNACQVLVAQLGDVDQRGTGFPRRTDGNGDRVTVCDIGAFEKAVAAVVGGGGGGGGGGCVAGTTRGVDPLFPLLLAIAGAWWGWRRRSASRAACFMR